MSEDLYLPGPSFAFEAGVRKELEQCHGQVWSTDELTAEFQVLSFLAPYVEAVRKADGVCGSLQFTASPRFYHSWVEDRP